MLTCRFCVFRNYLDQWYATNSGVPHATKFGAIWEGFWIDAKKFGFWNAMKNINP